MDTKILVGMSILVIFVVIIGILMMKNKDSYTDPTIPSTTDPTSVFTPAGMAFLFSSDGVLSPAGSTWIHGPDGISFMDWLESTDATNWASTAQGASAQTYIQTNYPKIASSYLMLPFFNLAQPQSPWNHSAY